MTGGFSRWIGLAGSVWWVAAAASAEVAPPPGLVKQLTSESYPERVRAQEDLARWAGKSGDQAIGWLLEASASADDPEVRSRAFDVLRQRVMTRLESERPGFIGVTMIAGTVEWKGVRLPSVQVTSVQDGSPADRAGLKRGDEIVALDGGRWKAGDTPEQLALKVGAMKPGREIRLEVLRGGERQEFDLKLAARPWAAGEWGELRPMRFNPLLGRPSIEQFEDEARDEAFQRWLEEHAHSLAPR